MLTQAIYKKLSMQIKLDSEDIKFGSKNHCVKMRETERKEKAFSCGMCEFHVRQGYDRRPTTNQESCTDNRLIQGQNKIVMQQLIKQNEKKPEHVWPIESSLPSLVSHSAPWRTINHLEHVRLAIYFFCFLFHNYTKSPY